MFRKQAQVDRLRLPAGKTENLGIRRGLHRPLGAPPGQGALSGSSGMRLTASARR